MRTATPAAVSTRGLSRQGIRLATEELARRDPRLGAIIRENGPCGLASYRSADPFGSLVGTIISQQLSTSAAETIRTRVFRLADGAGGMAPAAVLSLETSALRAAGLSNQKVAYVRDLAAKVLDGTLDLHALNGHDDEEVITRITAVKGLGRWSAQMFLMFRLNRPDVLPTGDLGIVKGFQIYAGMKRRPAERTMVRLAEPWRPYRSVACWYLWRLLE